jgi:hypothetical protein
VAALLLAESVRVDEPEPGATMLDGLNVALTPKGMPLATSEIELLKPPEIDVVMVEVPELPGDTVTEPGLADTVKLGEPPLLTVSVTLVVSVSPPPLPVIVIV